MSPAWCEELTANSDRPEVRCEIARLIAAGLARVEPIRGDRERPPG